MRADSCQGELSLHWEAMSLFDDFPLGNSPIFLRIAVPVPLRRAFDYLPPIGMQSGHVEALVPGVRVQVPFGRQKLVGILLAVVRDTDMPPDKLKPAVAVLDEIPCLPPVLFELALWASDYYQYPVGEVLAAALPVALRDGSPLWPVEHQHWRQTDQAAKEVTALRAGTQQAALYKWLDQQQPSARNRILAAGFSPATISALANKGFIERVIPPPEPFGRNAILREEPLALNDEQTVVVDAVVPGRFQTALLEGVTGSGKTEVYLQLIARVLARGEQAMVLVPEIGLTPQTVARFERRFQCQVAVMHSGLTDSERFLAWRAASRGEAGVLIGTRSALFTPLARPGILIVDEEHDSSFKQQEGFRYSARDLAVLRGQRENIPVVLGSATPSLETLHNAMHERYSHLRLTTRAGNARSPTLEVIDIHNVGLTEGFSSELLCAMREELQKGNQVLVFLNRRGFAPALVCADCRWQAECEHCSARMTVHKSSRLLRCHHCDYQRPLPTHCPQCRGTRLDCVGVGTQRSEQFLQQQFAEYPVLRMDRDSTSRKESLQGMLDTVNEGKPCLLVGTQMLAKGHHFPHVTLVAMLDIDHGLFAADFRGAEKMGQLLEQVAGRAGRADKPGRVLIQSRFAEHPLIQTLLQEGYQRLARMLLRERQLLGLPPYTYMALIRAEHADAFRAQQLLEQWRESLRALVDDRVQVSGPFPAVMERRAGFYRFDLQLKSPARAALQKQLALFCAQVEKEGLPKGIRWSLDVDPSG